MIRGNQSMALVAEHLGMLAHLVADANNPFHTSDADPRLGLMHDDFEQYFERRMAHFPTVFYGLSADFQLGNYLDRTVARSSRLLPLMSEEYFRDGAAHRSLDFDDRSTAFGVASVCYSHALTDLVNLYYYIWREAGGDVRSAAAPVCTPAPLPPLVTLYHYIGREPGGGVRPAAARRPAVIRPPS